MKRLAIQIQGQIQGVGFRPHVYRIAQQLGLTGWVQNNAAGVKVEIQGTSTERFMRSLLNSLPRLAKVEQVTTQEISTTLENSFLIKKSQSGKITAKILPDVSVCEDCLNELFEAKSHYYRYPFISCVQCGPRYSIVSHLPYDRASTAMAPFILCEHCHAAYTTLSDRRYHAESIACHNCGPKLSHSFAEIAAYITSGKVVALKSVGGFQLLCDARNEQAVKKLREKKARENKPFAVMVLNTESANTVTKLDLVSRHLLESLERPIVLMPKRRKSLPSCVAPALSHLGVMLPYSPTHYLIFNALQEFPEGSDWLKETCDTVLVVTSANISGSPLIKENDIAQHQLADIADVIVTYNRKILARVDDSVVKVIANKPAFIRRARSFVPQAISLPYDVPSTLALGGHLKNTICLTRGKEAFVSQHIGNLNQRETVKYFHETITHFLKLFDIKPEVVACDLHPNFYSSQIAHEFDVPVYSVQHHHAHLAACAIEHQVMGEAIGLALDGFGLGEADQSLGGELMLYQGTAYKHLGSLLPIMQPGGEGCVKEPWRMAASVLNELGLPLEIEQRFAKYPRASAIANLLAQKVHSPRTSSCGRLFDAVSALLGLCEVSTYEGEAAMRLESFVTTSKVNPKGWEIQNNQLSLLPLLKEIRLLDACSGANFFHGTLAAALVEWVTLNAKACQRKQVLLAGGCFLNKVLSEAVISGLIKHKFTPYYPRCLPVNDGGLSLGQAWIAANKFKERG